MPRITSKKIRQFIFVENETIEPGFTPDSLALFMPDGTPIDLTRDGTRMHWTGDWSDTAIYLKNDVVTHDGAIWIAPDDMPVGVVPTTAPELRTAHAYSPGAPVGTFNNVPILKNGVPFVDFASAPEASIFYGGSKLVSFDALPDSIVTISFTRASDADLALIVAWRDTGEAGTGNTRILENQANPANSSPWTFHMPAEGRVSIEMWPLVTGLTVLGDGVSSGDPHRWVLFSAASGTGPAGPAGVDGAAGPQGPAGADGADGGGGTGGGMVFKGTYLADTNYDLGAVVTHDGFTWVNVGGTGSSEPVADTDPYTAAFEIPAGINRPAVYVIPLNLLVTERSPDAGYAIAGASSYYRVYAAEGTELTFTFTGSIVTFPSVPANTVRASPHVMTVDALGHVDVEFAQGNPDGITASGIVGGAVWVKLVG